MDKLKKKTGSIFGIKKNKEPSSPSANTNVNKELSSPSKITNVNTEPSSPSVNTNVNTEPSSPSVNTNVNTELSSSSENTNVNTEPLRHIHIHPVQNFLLVWLDSSIDEVNNADSINAMFKLREIVNTVYTFTTANECANFISGIEKEKVFMISSGGLGQTAVPIVHEMPQISKIYVFCQNKAWHEDWAKNWAKVNGVFTDMKPIYEALKQATYECDQNSIPMSFVATNGDTKNKSLDQLDQSFVCTQILKEILLNIDFEQKHIQEFITYCRQQFASNTSELKNIDKLEKEYHTHLPIWWYSYQCFLYPMLNRSLRMMEMDLIMNMGFFVKDLYKHIERLHSEQHADLTHSTQLTVYRGQGLSQKDFDKLFDTKGGLLSFNSFLSTSMNQQVSLDFAHRTIETSDLVGILFVMKIDPSILSTPFANVRSISYVEGEDEILFSMQSVFRIEDIKQMDNNNNRLWEVKLTLVGDNDPDLHSLTEQIREETFSHVKGWHQMGNLLINLGQFEKAQQLFEIILDQKPDELEEANIYHMLGINKNIQGEYIHAITYYEKSIEIKEKILSPTHSKLAASYSNIGLVYNNIGDYSKALSFHEKAFEIRQKTLPENHPLLATSYACQGSVYDNMGNYSKALSFHEKALEIRQEALPENHLLLAISYNNIGLIYDNIGDYSQALSSHEQALEIGQKALPENHPHLATSYNNMGSVYDNMGDYSKALSYYEKAFEIRQKTLPQNHPLLATSHNNIGLMYDNMGDYSKALSFHEKALEIGQKALPENHLLLAISYNNIGLMYDNMGDYSKALSSHEKALEIEQKTLSEDHPSLATTYNNIGLVYNNMGDYSKALSYYEKALEIRQNILPPVHPDLATSYSNIGVVYDKKDEYTEALSFYERALEIGQCVLPENHPYLQTYTKNVERVSKKL